MSVCSGCGQKQTQCVDCLFLLCGVVGCAVYQDSTFLFALPHERCRSCDVLRCVSTLERCRCQQPFYFVTPTLAIGNQHADESAFDVLIDLNYPSNGCAVGEIREDDRRLSAGLPSGEDDLARACWAKTVTAVNQFLGRRNTHSTLRVLFRSERGQTRSVLVCMYYLFRAVYFCPPSKVLVLVMEQATRPVRIPPALAEMFGLK